MVNSMKKGSFEYCLNAIHYCMGILESKFSGFIDVILYNSILLFTKIFLPSNIREKAAIHIAETNRVIKSARQGVIETSASDSFGYIYSGYPEILSFILVAISWKIRGVDMDAFTYILIALPIIIGYIPAYKAVYSHDKYRRYFGLFSKESRQWHRKWIWRTILFIFGGSLGAFAIGILLMWKLFIQ